MQAYCQRLGRGLTGLAEDRAVSWDVNFADGEKEASLPERILTGDVLVVYTLDRVFSSCYDAEAIIVCFKAQSIHQF